MKMPVLFLGHGSPMNAIADNNFTKSLTELSNKFEKPKAVLVISAHWETEGTYITAMDKPKTIHDFRGFPEELYQIQYPAPGNPELAKDIQTNINELDIKLDYDWGLDHGTWSVLRFVFPNADIPVLQLSLDMTKPFQYHFELGKKLRFLREQGILIVGSGNITHNLRKISWEEKAPVVGWAIEFDEWVKDKAMKRDFKPLIESPTESAAGKISIPTPEHYLPFLYILGASEESDQLHFDIEEIQNASISMRSFRFSS